MNDATPDGYEAEVRGALVIAWLSGCTSVGAFQRAETLPPGAMEASIESSLGLTVGRDTFTTVPMGGVRGRFGLAERVDLSVRLGPMGLEAQPKIMLTARDGPVVVSLAPSVGGTFVAPNNLFGGALHASLPVYVGVRLSNGHQLVLVPRLHDALTTLSAGSVGGTVNVFSVGGAVGLALAIGQLEIVPDVGVLIPVTTTTWRSDLPTGTALGSAKVTFQSNLTFSFRSRR